MDIVTIFEVDEEDEPKQAFRNYISALAKARRAAIEAGKQTAND